MNMVSFNPNFDWIQEYANQLTTSGMIEENSEWHGKSSEYVQNKLNSFAHSVSELLNDGLKSANKIKSGTAVFERFNGTDQLIKTKDYLSLHQSNWNFTGSQTGVLGASEVAELDNVAKLELERYPNNSGLDQFATKLFSKEYLSHLKVDFGKDAFIPFEWIHTYLSADKLDLFGLNNRKLSPMGILSGITNSRDKNNFLFVHDAVKSEWYHAGLDSTAELNSTRLDNPDITPRGLSYSPSNVTAGALRAMFDITNPRGVKPVGGKFLENGVYDADSFASFDFLYRPSDASPVNLREDLMGYNLVHVPLANFVNYATDGDGSSDLDHYFNSIVKGLVVAYSGINSTDQKLIGNRVKRSIGAIVAEADKPDDNFTGDGNLGTDTGGTGKEAGQVYHGDMSVTISERKNKIPKWLLTLATVGILTSGYLLWDKLSSSDYSAPIGSTQTSSDILEAAKLYFTTDSVNHAANFTKETGTNFGPTGVTYNSVRIPNNIFDKYSALEVSIADTNIFNYDVLEPGHLGNRDLSAKQNVVGWTHLLNAQGISIDDTAAVHDYFRANGVPVEDGSIRIETVGNSFSGFYYEGSNSEIRDNFTSKRSARNNDGYMITNPKQKFLLFLPE